MRRVTPLSCKRDQIKRKIIWTGGLPNLPGVPHLHINRPSVTKPAPCKQRPFYRIGREEEEKDRSISLPEISRIYIRGRLGRLRRLRRRRLRRLV